MRRLWTLAFLGTGTMVALLKHVGTADWDKDKTNNSPSLLQYFTLRTPHLLSNMKYLLGVCTLVLLASTIAMDTNATATPAAAAPTMAAPNNGCSSNGCSCNGCSCNGCSCNGCSCSYKR